MAVGADSLPVPGILPGGWEAGKLEGREAGRLGGREAGRLEDWEAGRLEGLGTQKCADLREQL